MTKDLFDTSENKFGPNKANHNPAAIPNIDQLQTSNINGETNAEVMYETGKETDDLVISAKEAEEIAIDEALEGAGKDETYEEAVADEEQVIEERAEGIANEEKVEEDEKESSNPNEFMVNLKINDIPVTVPEGTTVLLAALKAGVKIPTLCYLKDVNAIGSCRMCVVEVKGMRNLAAACVYPVNEGMEVYTDTKKVRNARKINMELILSNHRMDCLTCERSRDCELRTLAADLNVDTIRFQIDDFHPDPDTSAMHLIRDNTKCILCRRCTAVCKNRERVGVIGAIDRGFATHIGSPFERGLGEVSCTACGQCITACPTGAITLKRQSDYVLDAIKDPDKIVVATTAPAVRVGLGDQFGLPVGTNVEGKMVAALRRLGFDMVFDVDFGADMTIMEESSEFMERLKEGKDLPMFTSCCPAWIRYIECYHPELLAHVSTCRSPQAEIGSLLKTWYAEKEGLDPEKIVHVTVMPCTAKKYEIDRQEMRLPNGCMPSDYSITTRELADMITNAGIMFDLLPEEDFDHTMGESSGAGDIFGASGGVMEAALRTAAAILSGSDEAAPLEFKEVRGMEGVKEATYTVGDVTLRTCTVSGLSNIEDVIAAIERGDAHYDFVEVMACPGGCVNGGGQPLHSAFEKMVEAIPADRAKGLYKLDASKKLRRSDENPEVQAVYKDYLGEPGGHKSHELLHTTYFPMKKHALHREEAADLGKGR